MAPKPKMRERRSREYLAEDRLLAVLAPLAGQLKVVRVLAAPRSQ
jgi:hypothetical protein